MSTEPRVAPLTSSVLICTVQLNISLEIYRHLNDPSALVIFHSNPLLPPHGSMYFWILSYLNANYVERALNLYVLYLQFCNSEGETCKILCVHEFLLLQVNFEGLSWALQPVIVVHCRQKQECNRTKAKTFMLRVVVVEFSHSLISIQTFILFFLDRYFCIVYAGGSVKRSHHMDQY